MMARLARAEVFAADEVAIVHVMNRTVRRCFLLGDDPVTGKNYDHRKQWIDDQLVHQARYFGIDLLCQAIMSNHFHLVLRSRPDVVAEWDDSEVARRWLMLCPLRRDERRQPLEPTEEELNSIRKDKDKLQQVRARLSDISWWMRLLSQNIAQRANRDDEEVGKFWQARYRAVRLLDETAILACAAYVDLNPIRAAMAETVEGSDYTSAQKRCHDLQAARSRSTAAQTAESATQAKGSAAPSRRARHLAPVDLKERSAPTGPQVHQGGSRCSNKGFLPMTTADYLELLDWTARGIHPGKPGRTPKHIPRLLDRLGVNAEMWQRLVSDFGRLFSVVAGQPHRIDEHQPKRTGSRHRYRARRETRELFSTA
jgi:hypothetical protein